MFLISLLESEPLLDAMPVIKTIHYPWAEDNFKPLAYTRLAAVKGKGIFCDIQAFEKNPDVSGNDVLGNSCVAISFDFMPGSEKVFTVAVDSNGDNSIYINGEQTQSTLELTPLKSRGELGWYWSVQFYITENEIKKHFSVSKIQNRHKMKGNIYKLQRAGSVSHLGAAAPVKDNSIFSRGNLADFTVVSY